MRLLQHFLLPLDLLGFLVAARDVKGIKLIFELFVQVHQILFKLSVRVLLARILVVAAQIHIQVLELVFFANLSSQLGIFVVAKNEHQNLGDVFSHFEGHEFVDVLVGGQVHVAHVGARVLHALQREYGLLVDLVELETGQQQRHVVTVRFRQFH